jgi:hypothetical protein
VLQIWVQIGVQIVSTGHFAHRFKFERTRVLNTVLARIKELAGDTGPIVLEDDAVSFNDLVSDGVMPSDSIWGSEFSIWGSEFMLSSEELKASANDGVEPRQTSEVIENGDRDDGPEANIADNERELEVLSDQGPRVIEVEAEVADTNADTVELQVESNSEEDQTVHPEVGLRGEGRYNLRPNPIKKVRIAVSTVSEYYPILKLLYRGYNEKGELLENAETILTIMAAQVGPKFTYAKALKTEHR